jgi:hypothetical protein
VLRALALTALIANLSFFAWTQGYLKTLGLPPLGAGEREPQRLQRQVSPETIVILNPSVSIGRQGASAQSGPSSPASATDGSSTASPSGNAGAAGAAGAADGNRPARDGALPSTPATEAATTAPQGTGSQRERGEPGR